jgi:hypothetical protein
MTWLLWGRFFILGVLLTLAIALAWAAVADRE